MQKRWYAKPNWHPDEKEIEAFALGAPVRFVAFRQIQAHLDDECPTCSSIFFNSLTDSLPGGRHNMFPVGVTMRQIKD